MIKKFWKVCVRWIVHLCFLGARKIKKETDFFFMNFVGSKQNFGQGN